MTTTRSVFSGAFGSAFIGVCLFIVLLPMLATSPLSGDGAELVALATHGGVPHAPGFPLQAWLGRLFVQMLSSMTLPTTEVALISALAHATAAALVAEAVRALGGSMSARALAALAFALFPSTWALGVQPEVFALAHMFLAALLLGAVRASIAPPTPAAAVAWGAVVGLALAHHPITIVVLPAVVVGVAASWRGGGARAVVGAGAAALSVYAGLYATIPALRTASPWPDWGDVDSLGDVVQLALRRDYGTTRLSAGRDGFALSGVAVLARALVESFVPQTVLALLGGWALRTRHSALVAVCGTVACALAFLTIARFGVDRVVATAYLERFQGLFIVPAALLAGLGVDVVAQAARARGRLLGAAVAVAVALGMFFGGQPAADASARHELAALRLALGASLPPEAVWLAGADDEVFGGALAQDGDDTITQRWPIAAHLLTLPWYRDRVVPRVSTGIPWSQAQRPLTDAAAVASFALSRGRPVASTDRALAEASGAPARLDGLMWIADGHDGDELTWRTVEGATLLCTWVDDLRTMPDDAPAFGRGTWSLFARAFDGAAQYLERVDPQAGADAEAIARALQARTQTPEVTARCARLRARVESMRSDQRKSIADDPNRPSGR